MCLLTYYYDCSDGFYNHYRYHLHTTTTTELTKRQPSRRRDESSRGARSFGMFSAEDQRLTRVNYVTQDDMAIQDRRLKSPSKSSKRRNFSEIIVSLVHSYYWFCGIKRETFLHCKMKCFKTHKENVCALRRDVFY